MNNIDWNTNPPFAHGVKLNSGHHHQVADSIRQLIPGRIRDFEKKCLNYSSLVGNVTIAYPQPLSVSMDRNNWTPNPYRTATYFIPELVRLLAKRNEIIWRKGSIESHRISRILMDNAYLDKYSVDDVDYTPPAYVVLKDFDGVPISFEPTAETKEIERVIRQNHQVNSVYKIRALKDGKVEKLFTGLHAIFNGSFELHGRMYTSTCIGYQNLRKTERATITFDGEPSVEYDFEGMGPRLLYALNGSQYDDDPYRAVINDSGARPIVKFLLNALLNASDERSAIGATWEKITKQKTQHQQLYPDCHYSTCAHSGYELYSSMWRNYDWMNDLSAVVKLIGHTHKRISRWFCTGIGTTLMNYDSSIARQMMDYFGKNNYPILAIHDSFIVPAKVGEILKEVMEESFHEVTGHYCPISRK